MSDTPLNPSEEAANDQWRQHFNQRLGNVELGLSENTKATKRIEENTNEVVELMRDLKAAWRIIDIASKVAKPVGWVAGVGTAVLALLGSVKGWWSVK